ncbi:hypothetical protein [Streptomyces sp. NPDC002602]|uniref:hypothetical protein n=1 Tax=Streptomyces sp. NPDC002602 TaxID=3364654 RepID=UPI0036AE4053
MGVHRGGAGDLDPLREDLPEPVRVFVSELRVLFRGLPDTSVRGYAATHHVHFSTVSRFLSGDRLPQWSFVTRLLQENAAAREAGIQAGVLEHLRGLYDEAVKVTKPGNQMHLLRDELTAALAELQAARVHEQVLIEALRQREETIRELTGTLALGQAQHHQDRLAHAAELDVRDREIEALRATVTRLRAEITLLQGRLDLARAHTADIELRAEDVEEALAQAEDADESASEARDTPGTVAVAESPPPRTVAQMETLQVGLRAIGVLIDNAHATERIHRLTGVARSHLDALLERPAQDPASDKELDRLIELLLMAMSREEDETSRRSYPLSSLVGRRPHEAARSDFGASVFCLMLAELYRARGHQDLQQKLRVRAQEHFSRGYPYFMGKPTATGSKWNYRAGTVSYVSEGDKTRHALQVRQVKDSFDNCQEHLKPSP